MLDDVHRDNFVYSNGNWKLIDFDGVVLAPLEYQLASFIAAFILIEDEKTYINIGFVNETCILNRLDKKMVLNLVNIRLFTGLCYFYEKKDSDFHNFCRYKFAGVNWIEYVQSLDNDILAESFANIKTMMLELE